MGDAVRGFTNELRFLQQMNTGRPLRFGGKKKKEQEAPVLQIQPPQKVLGGGALAPQKPHQKIDQLGPMVKDQYSDLPDSTKKLIGYQPQSEWDRVRQFADEFNAKKLAAREAAAKSLPMGDGPSAIGTYDGVTVAGLAPRRAPGYMSGSMDGQYIADQVVVPERQARPALPTATPNVLPTRDEQYRARLVSGGIRDEDLQNQVLSGLDPAKALAIQQDRDETNRKIQADADAARQKMLGELEGIVLALESTGVGREDAIGQAIGLHKQGETPQTIKARHTKLLEDAAEARDKRKKELKEYDAGLAKTSKEFTAKSRADYEQSQKKSLRRKLGKEKGLKGAELDAYVEDIDAPKVEKVPTLTPERFNRVRDSLDTWFDGQSDRDTVTTGLSATDPAARQDALMQMTQRLRSDPGTAAMLDRELAGLTNEEKGKAIAEWAFSLKSRSGYVPNRLRR